MVQARCDAGVLELISGDMTSITQKALMKIFVFGAFVSLAGCNEFSTKYFLREFRLSLNSVVDTSGASDVAACFTKDLDVLVRERPGTTAHEGRALLPTIYPYSGGLAWIFKTEKKESSCLDGFNILYVEDLNLDKMTAKVTLALFEGNALTQSIATRPPRKKIQYEFNCGTQSEGQGSKKVDLITCATEDASSWISLSTADYTK